MRNGKGASLKKVEFNKDELENLWPVERVAEKLSMGTRTIWRYDAAGLIPAAKKIGKKKRWDPKDIQLWIELGCPVRKIFNRLKEERKSNGKTKRVQKKR